MTALLERQSTLKGYARFCKDGIIEVKAWCPNCKRYHLHGLPVERAGELKPGAVIGHWASHCTNPASPYYNGGYEIEIVRIIMMATGTL